MSAWHLRLHIDGAPFSGHLHGWRKDAAGCRSWMQTQRQVPTRHHLANLGGLGQSTTVATLRPYGAHRLAETIGANSETAY